jgi:steroid delta-isomerase-like uncharacterized protein
MVGTPATTDESRAVVLGGFDELWLQRRPELADKWFTPDLTFQTTIQPEPFRGPDGFREFYRGISGGFPDYDIHVDEVVAEGDKVVLRFTFTGTNTGDYFGIPSTGKPVTIRFVEIFTVRDGQIAGIWHVANVLDVMQQLGFLPKSGLPKPVMWMYKLRSKVRQRRAGAVSAAGLVQPF